MRRFASIALTILLCGCSTTRQQKIASAAAGEETPELPSASDIAPRRIAPVAHTHLLGFKAQRYSGPRGTQSRSQAALVAFEFEGGSWRLAHVGRWRDEDSGVWPAWEPRI